MSDKTSELIGKILDGPKPRDAIHIAVVAIVAGEYNLRPGEHVGLNNSGQAVTSPYCDKTIGVVDPFLHSGVNKGEVFWLFLYPNTITSLRHSWTHPAFQEQESQGSVEESEKWLLAWCGRNEFDYQTLLDGARYRSKLGKGAICLGDETPDALYNDDIQSLVIMHLNRVLGTHIPETSGFRCAC